MALSHKNTVRDRLRDLADAAGADEPDDLADALLLVMDGAFAAARMFGPDNPGRRAGSAARALIAGHAGPRSITRRSRRPAR